MLQKHSDESKHCLTGTRFISLTRTEKSKFVGNRHDRPIEPTNLMVNQRSLESYLRTEAEEAGVESLKILLLTHI